jgi:FkbM family methyltransferase
MKKIAYDVGANIGQNLPYYSKKFDLVVAIEADPELIPKIQSLNIHNVVIENCAVSNTNGDVKFYRNCNSVLSQLDQPDPSSGILFTEIMVPARTLSSIVNQYGDPFYIKIDIEHHDHVAVKDLFDHEIYPQYLSAEMHESSTVDLILESNRYNEYRVVEGNIVNLLFKDLQINTKDGIEHYSFPYHSAGPCCDDLYIITEMDKDSVREYIKENGLGWKDLHAKLI